MLDTYAWLRFRDERIDEKNPKLKNVVCRCCYCYYYFLTLVLNCVLYHYNSHKLLTRVKK